MLQQKIIQDFGLQYHYQVISLSQNLKLMRLFESEEENSINTPQLLGQISSVTECEVYIVEQLKLSPPSPVKLDEQIKDLPKLMC